MPDPLPSRGSRGRLELLAQIGSLVATAWIVWNVSALPRTAFPAPASAIWRAVGFTLLAWLGSAVVALALQFTICRVEGVRTAGATLRTSVVAVWFAPAMLLMYRFSVPTALAALVLVVNATRLLYSQWRIVNPAVAPAEPAPGTAVLMGDGGMPPPFLGRHMGTALAVASGVQCGIAAAMFLHPLLAGGLLILSIAVLTVFAISTGAWEPLREPSLPREVFGALLTVALAVSLTVLATGGGQRSGSGGDGSGSAGDEASSPPLGDILAGRNPAPSPPQSGSARQANSARDPSVPGAGDVPGSFPGVILWPEIQPVTRLIAPLPQRPGALAASPHIYGIPFGGEYWFFRMPFRKPPPSSVLERGTPWKISFSTTDRWPLNMEAHQKLEQAVEVSCCSRIEIAVSNADRYPHTVSLELILRNLPGTQTQSLGTVRVESIPDLNADPITPVAETLEFTMPREPRIRAFNEITVQFHREYWRVYRSARVSIERFVLIPRGRK